MSVAPTGPEATIDLVASPVRRKVNYIAYYLALSPRSTFVVLISFRDLGRIDSEIPRQAYGDRLEIGEAV